MTALLRWSNTSGAGDAVLDPVTHRIVECDPLVADLFMSLYVDAPADDGDPVPEGVEVRGNWAQQLGLADAANGSKLWMLRYVKPAARAQVLGKRWAEDALAPLVTAGRLATVAVEAAYVQAERRINLSIDVKLTDGTRRTFETEVEYAV